MNATAPRHQENLEISVLCVDDNPSVAEVLKWKITSTPGLLWKGWLPSADDLVTKAAELNPTVVLLDIDMPGKDPFEAVAELRVQSERMRVVMFSGHIRREYLDRAMDSGAWGYVSKNDGEEELIRCLRSVGAGEFVMSPEVQRLHDTF